jgi:hypothetical protein
VGRYAKSALRAAGYELTRPTSFERSLVRSYWADWFSKDPALFARIYQTNRNALAKVPSWADNIGDSLWRYGVPTMWSTELRELGRTALDEIEPEITYTDLIGFIASQLTNLRYLEIGVSVGKNLWQIANLFPDAALFGLDVEEPNPSLVRLFERVEIIWKGGEQTVDTLSGKPATIELTHYRLHRLEGEPLTYIRGDQFSPKTWDSMEGAFNFVFSDGVHSGDAVRTELAHLQSRDLLAAKRALYWDDLVNIDMQSAFADNVGKLGPGTSGLYALHGTYGERRLNGFFSNI